MRLLTRFAALCLAAALLCGVSLADTFTGAVAAGQTALVTAPAGGLLTAWSAEVGQTVAAGEALGSVRETRVFSPLDGTVAAIHAEEGDLLSGTVVEIAPESRYAVICTLSGYIKADGDVSMRIGDTLYLKCVADGTHRAVGIVTDVNGANYTVETTSGELYVGEAVNVYRTPAYDAVAGRGTVTVHDTVAVAGSGVMTRLHVRVGDRVWRGQWLFAVLDTTKAQAASSVAEAPEAGIIVSVAARRGDSVREGDTLAEIATSVRLRVEISTDELGHFTPGQVCTYQRADDRHGTRRQAVVTQILNPDNAETATIELVPMGDSDLPIGLTVQVDDGR